MAVRRFVYFDGADLKEAATSDTPSGAATAGLGGVSAGTQVQTSGTVVFADANGVSFGLTAGTLTASVGPSGGLTAVNFSANANSTNATRLVFADGNGVSFGLNGQTLTASVAPGGGGITGINVGAGTTTQGLSDLVFVDSHNVSFGLDGSTITGSASFPAQTVQPGIQAIGAGTTTATTGPVVFANANGLSFGLDAGTVTGSYTVPTVPAQTVQTQGVVVPAAGTQTATSGTVLWGDSNGISFGMSGSTRITASYTVPNTAGLISAVNVSAGTKTEDAKSLTFADANGVSFGLTGGTITASVAAPVAQTVQTQNVVVPSAGTQTATSGTLVFANSNGLSFGMSGSSQVTASYTVPSTAGLISAVNLSAGATSGNATAFTLADANNVSFGLNAGTLTASASFPAQTVQTQNVVIPAAGTQTATSGSVLWADSNGISFGMSGSTRITASYTVPSTAGLVSAVNFSAGTTSGNQKSISFANSNGLSFGLDAGTITASYTVPSTAGLLSAVKISAGTVSNNLSALTFADGNGVSFGLNASTLTASVASQTNQTVGLFGLGNTTQNSSTTRDARSLSFNGLGIVTVGFSNGSIQLSASQSAQTQSVVVPSAGTQTATSGTVVWGNSNGISFGMSGSSQITASYTVPTQTNQTVGLYALGNTTQNSSTTLDARTISFNGLGIVTAGFSNGSVQISATQSAQTVGLFALGNTTQNSSTTRDARSLSFNGLGIITAGFSNGSIQISATQSAQTQNVVVPSAGTQTATSGTLVFGDSNGISFGMSGSTRITASYTVPTQSVQTLGGYAVGNTAGQSSSSTFDARTLSFSGAGIASVGYSGGAVVISVPAAGANINVSAGATSNDLAAITFADANGVSFGLTGSTMSASVAAQTNQTVGLYALGNTTQNSSSTRDARSLSFNGLGIITAGFSNGSIQISATQSAQTQNVVVPSAGTQTATSGTVSFANSNGISFGMSGSNQITASYTVPSTAGLVSAVNFSGGTTSGNQKSIAFGDANNVSFGLDAGTLTASASFPAQTVQSVGLYALGNTTQNSSSTRDARSLSFNGLGIVTVGFSNGSIQVSASVAAQSNQQITFFAGSNTTQGTSGTMNASSLIFAGAGLASVGITNGSVLVSATAPAQTVQSIGLYASSNTTLTSSGTADARSLSFRGIGAISVGVSASEILLSVPTQTVQSVGLYASSNTTLTSSGTADARSLSFRGIGGATVGVSASEVLISVAASNQAFSAQGGSSAFSTLVFTNSNGVSFSNTNGSIWGSVAAQTVQSIGLYASSNTTLTSSGTADARSLSFRGIGGISVGVSASEVLISGPTTVAQTVQTIGGYGLGNTAGQSSSTTIDARSLSLSGLGAASVGYSGGAAIISVPVQTVQSVGLYASSNTTLTSSGTADARSLSFRGIGGISVGISASEVLISGPTTAAQTNQTIGGYALGNTTAQSSSTTMDARSLSFSGLGIASVGYSAGAVVISVPAGGAAVSDTFGASNLGNTSGTSGVVTGSNLRFVLAGGNNITLSQSVNGSSATITISAFNQSVQSMGLYASSNTTMTSSGTADARSLSFRGIGAASVGVSASEVIISVPTQTVQSIGLYASSNTTLTSSGTADARSLSFRGIGGATVGVSASEVLISVAPQAFSAQGGSSAFSTLVFTNSNGVSFSNTNGSIWGSVAAQTVQSIGLYASSNTTLTSSGTADARSLSFRGVGGVSIGVSGSEVIISGGAGAAQTNQTIGFYGLGNTTQNSSTTLDARTVSLNGLGAMTVGYSNGSVQLSAPATSSLVGTGQISISTNGSTISIGVPNLVTVYSYDNNPVDGTGTALLSANVGSSGAATFIPIQIKGAYVAAGWLNMAQSMNFVTTGTSSGRQSLTVSYGLYTRGTGTNSTTIGTVTSGFYSLGVTYNNSSITINQPTTSNNTGYDTTTTSSAGVNITSGYTGVKLVQFPINSTLSPGQYWLGLFVRNSTSSNNCGISQSFIGAPVYNGLSAMAPIGSFSSQFSTGTRIPLGIGGNWNLGAGSFTSAAQTNLPVSIALSAMTQDLSIIPYIQLVSTL